VQRIQQVPDPVRQSYFVRSVHGAENIPVCLLLARAPFLSIIVMQKVSRYPEKKNIQIILIIYVDYQQNIAAITLLKS
jgi:hypothetical protein